MKFILLLLLLAIVSQDVRSSELVDDKLLIDFHVKLNDAIMEDPELAKSMIMGADLAVLNNPERVLRIIGTTPLTLAASYERKELCEMLLNAGANPSIESGTYVYTPLHLTHNISIVKLLIEHGADPGIPNSDGYTPLDFYYYRNKDCYYYLLDHCGYTIEGHKITEPYGFYLDYLRKRYNLKKGDSAFALFLEKFDEIKNDVLPPIWELE